MFFPLLAALTLPTPYSAYHYAYQDIQRLAAGQGQSQAERQQQTRYLFFPDTDNEKLARVEAVLRFWVNSISSEADLAYPRQVVPGLWAVQLDDYGWKRAVWEKLLDVPDPYFHVTLAQTVETVTEELEEKPYGYYDGPGGTFRRTETRYEKVKRKKKVLKNVQAAAPWLNPKDAAGLISLTQTQIPVVRADWFVFQTAISKDRKAGYYDFLNLGQKEADFQALVGVDIKLAQKVKRELRGMFGRSGVTLQNREVEVFDAITGPYWRSIDYADSKDRKNVLRLLDGDADPDATEQFGVLPNGLFAYWLGAPQVKDGKKVKKDGKVVFIRQDAAPDNIAADKTVRGNDLRVHVGRNCIGCHKEPLRPLNDWARRIYRAPFTLDAADYAKQRRLRQIYLGSLEAKLKQGNTAFITKLKEVNGLAPGENATAFNVFWDAYAEDDKDLALVARDVGLTEEDFQERLKVYLVTERQSGRKPDPVLTGLFQGIPLRVDHEEEILPLLMQLAGWFKP